MVDMYGVSSPVLSNGNIIIMCIMICAIFIVPAINYAWSKNFKEKSVLVYMGGANAGDNVNFIDYKGEPKELEMRNWYLLDWINEDKLMKIFCATSGVVVVVFLCMIVGGVLKLWTNM